MKGWGHDHSTEPRPDHGRRGADGARAYQDEGEVMVGKIELVVVGKRCVYLNDFRIAGGKPYVSENLPQHSFSVKISDVLHAIQGDAHLADAVALIRETVATYGKPGGPWNVPSDPGGWLDRSRAILARIDGEAP